MMYIGANVIFNRLTGVTAGLLLIVYGAISLWLGKAGSLSTADACSFWLCPEASSDSPTSFESPNARTISQAQARLLLDPASAYRWADTANSEIDANHIEQGRFCVRQALAAAPGNPAILFRAANVSLRMEDYPETLRQLTAVLRNPDLADYYDHVFALYSQMDLPMEDLLNQGLPQTPKAANAFLRFWVNEDKLDEAEETWNWINGHSLTNLQSAGLYVALLGKAGRWEEAKDAWSNYAGRIDSAYERSNWVYNSGFEMKPTDCPFDWHLKSDDKVAVARDPGTSYKGGVSLRLKFNGIPEGGAPPAYQMVALQPGGWQLKATIKTRQLTSDQGVVVRVVDAENPSRLDVATNSLEGTEEWTNVSRDFEVKPGTRLARVEIMRPKSQNQDIVPTGLVWVDAVELQPTQKDLLLKTTRLTHSGEPCESHGECGNREGGFQAASKKNPE